MLFTSRLERTRLKATLDSMTRAQRHLDSARLEAPPDSSPELSGCLCMLPFSFATTKQELNTPYLNINTVDLCPLAMYLLHQQIFSLVRCEVALRAQQRYRRRLPRLSSRQETGAVSTLVQTWTRADSGLRRPRTRRTRARSARAQH